MTKDEEIVLNMIVDILGEPMKENSNTLQYAFNCPICDEGRNKANLEISLAHHIYHCWSCDSGFQTDESKGSLRKFFNIYGTTDQKKLYNLYVPSKHKRVTQQVKDVVLPEGFITLDKIIKSYPPHKQAIEYLKSRGVTDDMAVKYNLGLTTTGKYAHRIIFPSYDINKKLNFFVGRSWGYSKPKYLGSDTPKDNIIFNEHLIDWNKDIFIVEGPFDSLFVDNAIVTLGSHLSEYKIEKIYRNAKADIIIGFDPDAKNKALKLYNELNGGKLWNKIKLLSLPEGEDIASLRGDVMSYLSIIK